MIEGVTTRIAVLTSGGDAPGMNAAIRAVVRCGLHEGWDVYGVRHGYAGLIAGDLAPLRARDVGGIMQQAGTVLRSARAPEFKQESGLRRALVGSVAEEVLRHSRRPVLIVPQTVLEVVGPREGVAV